MLSVGEQICWFTKQPNRSNPSKQTLYAITNQRALIISSSDYQLTSFDFASITHYQTLRNSDGSGSIIFKVEDLRDSEGDLIEIVSTGFHNLSEVDRIEKLLLECILLSQKPDFSSSEQPENTLWFCNKKPRIFTIISSLKLALGIIFVAFLSSFIIASLDLLFSSSSDQPLFILFASIFLLAGLGMLTISIVYLILAPYHVWRKDQKTAYSLTNKRLLISTSGKTSLTISIMLSPLNLSNLLDIKKQRILFVNNFTYDCNEEYYHYGLGFERLNDDSQLHELLNLLNNHPLTNHPRINNPLVQESQSL